MSSKENPEAPLNLTDSLRHLNRAQQQSTMKLQRRKWLLIAITAIVFVFVVTSVYVMRTIPEFNQYRLVRTYKSSESTNPSAPRTILHWSSFFGDKRWSLPDDTLGPAFFRDDLQCPVYDCEVTNNHDFLPSVDMFDAILFHTAEPFPLINSVPAKRSPRQFYVFALMEPPGETKHILSDEGGFYNLSMTYRLDSDIVWPYQMLLDMENGAVVAPAKYPVWRQPPAEWNDTLYDTIRQLWPSKNRTAAWFVSHCETLSQREKLAAALQKYIDVDIYGKCGTLSCPRSSKECDEMLDQKYKFYFSFENALCTDYVTEKLYNALKRDIIPVVFGGANYTRFLPPRSYIDAESFDSVKALADHLKYLSSNADAYMSYFWWRHYYRLGYRSPYCDLCANLHSQTNQQKTQSYRNIEQWWLGGSCRFEAKISF